MATGRGPDDEPSLSEAFPSEETPLIRRDSIGSNTAQVPVSLSRGLVILLTMGLLVFIQATNMSMMTTAQSDIAADLDAFTETTWFNSAYLIAMSSVTPLAGRLTQIFTPRVYVLFSCVMLGIGLFITAAAPKLSVFLLGRAITGCGSGGVLITGIILTLDLISKRRRGLFIGLINMGMTVGVSTGAVLAGLLTPSYGWRLIFWVQAPIALVLGPVLFFAVPSHPHYEHEDSKVSSLLQKLKKVDYAGALTLTISIFLLLFSLASPQIPVTPIVLCVVFLIGFLVVESKFASDPIVPIEVIKMRSVLLTCLAALISMTSRWAVLFYSPVYAMVVRGWSPASAGLILVPTNAGFGIGGLIVGLVHIRHGDSYYLSNILVYLLFAFSSLLLAILSTPSSPTIAYVFATFLNGFTIGASMNYTFAHILHLTNPNVHYIITALTSMARGFAGSFGSAIGGGYFQRELRNGLEEGFAKHGLPGKSGLIHRLLGSPALVDSLRGVEKEVAIQSYQRAIYTLLVGSFVITLVATLAQAGTGWTPPKNNEHSAEDGDRHQDD